MIIAISFVNLVLYLSWLRSEACGAFLVSSCDLDGRMFELSGNGSHDLLSVSFIHPPQSIGTGYFKVSALLIRRKKYRHLFSICPLPPYSHDSDNLLKAAICRICLFLNMKDLKQYFKVMPHALMSGIVPTCHWSGFGSCRRARSFVTILNMLRFIHKP